MGGRVRREGGVSGSGAWVRGLAKCCLCLCFAARPGNAKVKSFQLQKKGTRVQRSAAGVWEGVLRGCLSWELVLVLVLCWRGGGRLDAFALFWVDRFTFAGKSHQTFSNPQLPGDGRKH